MVPFLAGAASFLSPCVIPLIPGYLSYVSGVSTAELEAGAPSLSGRVLGHSLLFVLGFVLVFVALGASASTIGAALAAYRPVLNKIAGLFIVAMGLSLLGVLVGAAFAFTWTPCIGPILASVLVYAGAAGTVKTGAALLFIYAVGLGLPFILTGLAFTRGMRALRWLRRFARPIEALSGVTLVAVGALLLTNKMFYISIWAQRMFARFGLDVWRFF